MGSFVSFIVIAYNEAGNIGRTLDAISALSGLDNYEVIVVNDHSRDGTAQVVAGRAERNPRIRMIDLPENRGRGYARSTGVKAAVGDLVALVDADILLPLDWLLQAEAALGCHDAVGGTAVPDGDVTYVYRRCSLTPRVVGATTTITGNNGLYRRGVFDVVQFDPSLREGEDVALNQAARRHGLSFATVPGLLVEHSESKTFLDSLSWLFVSGMGATRQLLIYRQIRVPDLAAGAFLGAVAAGLLLATFARVLLGVASPVLLLLAVSAQHIRSRFEIRLSQWRPVATAIAVDSALLFSYFIGRIAGVSWLARRLSKASRGCPVTGSISSDGNGQQPGISAIGENDHTESPCRSQGLSERR